MTFKLSILLILLSFCIGIYGAPQKSTYTVHTPPFFYPPANSYSKNKAVKTFNEEPKTPPSHEGKKTHHFHEEPKKHHSHEEKKTPYSHQEPKNLHEEPKTPYSHEEPKTPYSHGEPKKSHSHEEPKTPYSHEEPKNPHLYEKPNIGPSHEGKRPPPHEGTNPPHDKNSFKDRINPPAFKEPNIENELGTPSPYVTVKSSDDLSPHGGQDYNDKNGGKDYNDGQGGYYLDKKNHGLEGKISRIDIYGSHKLVKEDHEARRLAQFARKIAEEVADASEEVADASEDTEDLAEGSQEIVERSQAFGRQKKKSYAPKPSFGTSRLPYYQDQDEDHDYDEY